MAKITASLILVVLVMTFVLNGYGVDGAGRGNINDLEKNGVGVHNSQKWWLFDCLFLYKKCMIDDFKSCPNYLNKCASKHHR
jgi:hypothetical protein